MLSLIGEIKNVISLRIEVFWGDELEIEWQESFNRFMLPLGTTDLQNDNKIPPIPH